MSETREPDTDLLLRGTLHSLDPARPLAHAALVRDGKFVAVGTRAACEAQARPGARVVDLGEGCATPGLVDAHGHLHLYGQSLADVSCEGTRDEASCVARVAARAASVPRGTWIRGTAWDETRWTRAVLPTHEALSQAVPDHPVVLSRVDVHASWCNAAALARAGIDRDTPDPPGGRIVRLADGAPSGLLVDNAMSLVDRLLPPPRATDLVDALERALSALAAVGLTGVHDAALSPDCAEALRRLAAEDRLPVRVYGMIDGQKSGEQLEAQLRRWTGDRAVGLWTMRAVKLFADGALGSRGAALFDSYADQPGNQGLLLLPPEELERRIGVVVRAGFQPCVHAIGDRACAAVLRAFISTRAQPVRPRVEHLQILRAADVPLLRAAGAVASMQPTHATSDAPWIEARLGQGTEAQRGAYAWRQALDAGAVLAFGSDFPIEGIDPRQGLHSAVVRRARGTGPGQGAWMPEQRLTLPEALRAFTWGAAFAGHAEEHRGLIREGHDADVTLFDRDLLAVPVEDLPSVPVRGTLVAGRLRLASGTPA